MSQLNIAPYLDQIHLPQPSSHKGQNGKVMVIGGSELFHAASQWALTVVSRMVDMVFYSSVPINNQLIKEAKLNFHNGIVIPRDEIENYIHEADVVLIGPGMERGENSKFQIPNSKQTINQKSKIKNREERIENRESRIENQTQEKNPQPTTHNQTPTTQQWNNDTQKVTNYLLNKFPDKKWVIDAGALQMVDPRLINEKCIITPHKQEFALIYHKRVKQLTVLQSDESHEGSFAGESFSTVKEWKEEDLIWFENDILRGVERYPELEEAKLDDFISYLKHASRLLGRSTILAKGKFDFVTSWRNSYTDSGVEVIAGGNPGMTKGGTGDVLAGLVAGLYAFSDDPFVVAVIASHVNKMAGDELFKSTGPFFNASDLADQIPKTLAKVFGFVK